MEMHKQDPITATLNNLHPVWLPVLKVLSARSLHGFETNIAHGQLQEYIKAKDLNVLVSHPDQHKD